MTRAPVSVVVLPSGGQDEFRACLDVLHPTLALRDEVIGVVRPADAAAKRALAAYPRTTVLTDDAAEPEARFAAGVAAARHDLVVLLDGDAIVGTHWRDPVVAAFDDPAVVAAGPRTHHGGGPQYADAPAEALAGVPAFKAYARTWRQEHRGHAEVDRLGPVCVAYRRADLTAVGGPAPDFDWAALAARGRLVVVESALVAHGGGAACALRQRPERGDLRLSASMIVKNEADVLAETLAAVRPFVDEILVYDTGSTDDTVAVARAHGATVVRGYWNDHFADARNRAAAHCRGRWVLVVDADERVEGDPAALRSYLDGLDARGGDDAESATIRVENVEDSGIRSMWSTRLFRRNRGQYVGRLHEQAVDRYTGAGLTSDRFTGIQLRHSGYGADRVIQKDKGNRNVRLAELSLGDSPEQRAVAQVNLARSRKLKGDWAGAVEACLAALAEPSTHTRLLALPVLIEARLELGDTAAAEAGMAQLRALGPPAAVTLPVEIKFAVQAREWSRVLELIDQVPEETTNHTLIVVRRSDYAGTRIRALLGLGRRAEALDLLRAAVDAGGLPIGLTEAAELLGEDGAARIAAAWPADRLAGLVPIACLAAPAAADALAEQLWARHGAEVPLLVLACWVGERVEPERAAQWSARVRASGLAEKCPLIATAANPERPARERVAAAATALARFDDPRAMPLLEDALAQVPEGEHEAVIATLRAVLPELAAALVPAEG